jgi:hypothetical protein
MSPLKIGQSQAETYLDFTADVDHFSLQVRLANAKHQALYSVHLTTTDKTTIRHYCEKIKSLIEASPLSTDKKEDLLNKLNSFISELDRDRARLEVVSDLFIGIAHIGAGAAKELEPARRLLELIARIFGKTKEEEEPMQLPRTETRQIEPPAREAPPPRRSGDVDDEIPF